MKTDFSIANKIYYVLTIYFSVNKIKRKEITIFLIYL